MGRKLFSLFLTAAFLANSVLPSFAQGVLLGKGMGALPEAGAMVRLSAPVNPPVLRGVRVAANDPLNFEFILDPGDKVREARAMGKEDDAMKAALKETSQRLMNYFLTTLTVPDEDIWVNLSPYEKDRITPEKFGETEMGRDLLAQDYLLKQITASLLYPEGESGKKFWARVYEEAQTRFGTTDIPVDTFNKVWIMPEKAEIYEKIDSVTGKAAAFVVASSLKVMLESDYLAMESNDPNGPVVEQAVLTDTQKLGQEMAREVIIPLLQIEVNEGENFASLRQVYGSIILALWYKEKLKDSVLSSVYVDRNKVTGVDVEDKEVTRKIWGQYVEAFKKGAVDLVREEKNEATGEIIPRKYFVGGFNVGRRDFIKNIGAFSALVATGLGLSVITAGCEAEYEVAMPSYYSATFIVLSSVDQKALEEDLKNYSDSTNEIEKKLHELAMIFDEKMKESGGAMTEPNAQFYFFKWNAMHAFVQRLKEIGMDYGNWKMPVSPVNLYSSTVEGAGKRTVRIETKWENGDLHIFDVVNVIGTRPVVIPKSPNLADTFFPEYASIPGWGFSEIFTGLTSKFPTNDYSPITFGPADVWAGLAIAGKMPDDLQGKDLPTPFFPVTGPSEVKYRGVIIKAIQEGDWAENVVVEKDKPVDMGASQKPWNEGGIDLKKSSMPIKVRNQGGVLQFNIDPAVLKDLDAAPGLKGKVLEISPLLNLPAFLGVNKN